MGPPQITWNSRTTARSDRDDPHWLLVGDLPCLGCGYNLRGLAGPIVRCPECGRDHDLRDPSPWKVKQLPLGVRQRQHWPASAVLWSFISFVVGLSCFPVAYLYANRFSPIAIIIALMPLAIIAVWLRCCIRWVRSSRDASWALSVLFILHLSSWAMLVGATGVFWRLSFRWNWLQLGFASLMLLSVPGFWWVRMTLKTGEQAGSYTQLSRDWKVPLEH